MPVESSTDAPPRRVAFRDAIGIWLGFLSVLLLTGLATGVWEPTTVDPVAAATDMVPLYGLLSAALVGIPVYVFRRFRYLTPAVVLFAWLAGSVLFGLTLNFGPIRSMYLAILYGFLPVIVFPIVVGIEYAVRRMRGSMTATVA